MPQKRNWKPCVIFALAALMFTMSSWPTLAAEKGTFTITVEDISHVMRSMRTTHNRTFRVRMPASDLATVNSTNWPSSATTLLPDHLRDVWFTFSDLVPLEEADEIMDVCQQQATLVQAKPDKYRLTLFVEISDADDASLSSADDLRVLMAPGYYLSCSLVRI